MPNETFGNALKVKRRKFFRVPPGYKKSVESAISTSLTRGSGKTLNERYSDNNKSHAIA